MKIIKKTAWLAMLYIISNFAYAQSFDSLLSDLNAKSFKAKIQAVEKLSEVSDERVLPTLKSMLDGALYALKSDGRIVVSKEIDEQFYLHDIVARQDLGAFEKSEIKKVRISNKVRRSLRAAIAVLELTSEDRKLRLSSAMNLLKKPDPALREMLVLRSENEKSESVKAIIDLVVARIDIAANDTKLRHEAVMVLASSVEPEAVGELNKLVEKDDEGNYLEADTELVELALKELRTVNSKLGLFQFFENVIFGMSMGSVLLLAAIGLAITFGVMGVINMAHGEMIMLGAYTTFAIQQMFPSMIEWSLLFAVPAAFIVSGSVGVLIERTIIRHLYGRPLDTLLATFGVSLILQQIVRMYEANNVPVISPEFMSGFFAINGALSITYNRIYIFIFSLLVLALLALVLKKTLMGLQMRAVTQDRAMATSMGIRSNWVDAMTFGLGSGIAGIAGVALSQITNVGPNLGQSYIVDSFMVVVFGGVGNLLGTFFGAMTLGILNKFLEPYAGAVVGKILVLIFIILFIQWRPRGLFALKGRFVDD
jgi:urea transport system permease protein